MSPHVETAIVVSKTLTLVLGGLITYLSYKAYRRTGAGALRALAAGFAVITTGAVLAGGLDVLVGVRLEYSILVQSVLTAAGFGVITYSLYAE